MNKNTIFIIAGEKSGDKLGAELILTLKKKNPNLRFLGVGGSLMQANGIESVIDIEELSIMGIVEILPKLRRLLKLKNLLVNEILSCEPICLITIDSPDFCLRVAKKVKKYNECLKTIHYVAPSLWAWRGNRGFKIAKYIDYILTLFPFEPKVLRKYGISSKFVGHPISSIRPNSDKINKVFRKRIGVGESDLLFVLLPGSRISEVNRLLPVFLRAIELLDIETSKLKILLPAPKTVVNSVKVLIDSSELNIKLFSEEVNNGSDFELLKSQIFSSADFALAASGTVTLELAAYNIPMVVGYDVNWISRLIIGMLLKIDHISLVNIILEKEIVPELVGVKFKADLIAKQLNALIKDESLRVEQKNGLLDVMNTLNKTDKSNSKEAGATVYDLLKEWHLI
jgi:lipid-A-disaccharide synthase